MSNTCIHCKSRVAEFKPYCQICYLKSIGFYKAAIREIQERKQYYACFPNDSPCVFEEIGWSFANKVNWVKLAMAVINCGVLNKTPKIPHTKITDFFSQWQIDVAEKYFLPHKAKFGKVESLGFYK